jgi:acetolactate synthase I/II/III large subunit
MSQKMTGAKFIADTIKGYGTTHVFFVEAILRHTLIELGALGIKRVLTHSEKTAAYMADGYAKVSRRPGICMAQSVGAANMASGLQDPYLGRTPVIALTGRQSPAAMYRNAYQEIIHTPLFEPVTKFNACVENIDQLPHLLRQAFRESTSGAPRPVHLDLIGHQAEVIECAEAELEVVVDTAFTQYPATRPEPDSSAIQEAVRLLTKAQRPVIVAAGGAKSSSAGPEIVELAEMLQIPVATSLNGKGMILENHPLSLGIVGRYSRWCANQAVSEADLVLYIGSNTGDVVSHNWKVPKQGTPIIQIDIDPMELGRNYPNTLAIAADAKKAVRRLIESVKALEPKTPWSKRAQQLVQDWKAELEPARNSDAVPMRVERVCKELTECLPENAILVSDTGFSSVWTGTMVYLTHPGQTYIRCAGSLGWGFPGSLGAKCAAPDRPVICFTGDGGFYYHLSELETARRCGINTITIVNNNSALGQCWVVIKDVFHDKPGKEELCTFSTVSFAKVAESFGCMGIRVERPEEISSAMKTALKADRPVVIELITDPNCKAPIARN